MERCEGASRLRTVKGALPRRAFTLIELLTVVAIIGMMASLLMVAVSASRNRTRVVRANAEVRELAKAWKQYWMIYQKWPSGFTGRKEMTAQNMAYLLGNNPQRINFMETQVSTSSQGFVDPWGTPYWVDFSPPQEVSEVEYYETTVHFPNRLRYLY